MSRQRTKQEAADELGLLKVSVKVQYATSAASFAFLMLPPEWKALKEAYKESATAGFSGTYFSIPPGVHVLALRCDTIVADPDHAAFSGEAL